MSTDYFFVASHSVAHKWAQWHYFKLYSQILFISAYVLTMFSFVCTGVSACGNKALLHSIYIHSSVYQTRKAVPCMMLWSIMSFSRNVRWASCVCHSCHPENCLYFCLHSYYCMLVPIRKTPCSSSFWLQFLWKDWRINTALS